MDRPSWYPDGDLKEPFEPVEITDAVLAFPGSIEYLLPPVTAIPDEFGNMNARFGAKRKDGADYWIRMQSTWFSKGLDSGRIKAKKGVDKDAAIRHLAAIQGSFAPKHEYKMAAVAFLASLWFERWD